MSKYISPQVIKKAKEIDLLTYFMNYNPNELVKRGIGTYSIKSYDSLIISNGLWHRFSTNEGGKSALDYLMKVEKMTLQDAVGKILDKEIVDYVKVSEEKIKSNKIVVVPKRANNNNQVIEYLKNRGIDEDIIKECIEKKLLYQEDKTNNIVFLGYDNNGNIKYAGCRSTNNQRIMRDARGSSKEFSFRLLSNIKNNSLHIFESAIDLLSYATMLKLKGYDYKSQNLLALAGVYQPNQIIEQSKVPVAIKNYLEQFDYTEDIILHLDNDISGRQATKAMKIALKKYNVYDIPVPYGKDINDYLCFKLGLKNRKEIEIYKIKKPYSNEQI